MEVLASRTRKAFQAFSNIENYPGTLDLAFQMDDPCLKELDQQVLLIPKEQYIALDSVLDRWISYPEEDQREIWTCFDGLECRFMHAVIVCARLLQQPSSRVPEAQKAMITVIYFKILSLPGNMDVFNAILFHNCMIFIKSLFFSEKETKPSKKQIEGLNLRKASFLALDRMLLNKTLLLGESGTEMLELVFHAMRSTVNLDQVVFSILSKTIRMPFLKQNVILQLLHNSCEQHKELTKKQQNELRKRSIGFLLQESQAEGDMDAEVELFIQNIPLKCPSSSDIRSHMQGHIIQLLKARISLISGYLSFMHKLSRNKKAHARLFAVEFLSRVIKDLSAELEDAFGDSIHSACIAIFESIISRCSDKLANVRAKALHALFLVLFETSGENFIATSAIKGSVSCFGGSEDSAICSLGTMLISRSSDPNSLVKKSALQVLPEIYSLFMEGETVYLNKILNAFFQSARDSSVSVRKECIDAMSSLREKADHVLSVSTAWLSCILELSRDREPSVQSKALKALANGIFFAKSDPDDHQKSCLAIIAALPPSLQTNFRHALEMTLKMDRILVIEMHKAVNELLGEMRLDSGLGILLQELSGLQPEKANHSFILKQGESMLFEFSRGSAFLNPHLVSSLVNISKYVDQEKKRIVFDLSEKCMWGSSNHMVDVKALASVLLAYAVDENYSSKLLYRCIQYVESISTSYLNSEQLNQHLFLIGQIVSQCNLSAPTSFYTSIFTLLRPSKTIELKDDTRAHCLIALGKMCVDNESQARNFVNYFIEELQASQSDVVKSNILLIFNELCKSSSSLVDQYLPYLTLHLADSSIAVRKTTLLVIAQLLQEGYLKWKSSLFLRFISKSCDDSLVIRSLFEQSLNKVLNSTQAETLFNNHFVESLFYFNGCVDHPLFNQFPSKNQEASFSLVGSDDDRRMKRMTVYRTLLSRMTEEQRFVASAKVCQDAIGSVVDGILPMNGCSDELIRDSLLLLLSEDLQIKIKFPGEAVDEQDKVQEHLKQAKTKLLSQLQQKNILQNVVPILIQLKNVLTTRHSPLVRYVMAFMRRALKDHPHDFEDLFGVDQQLAREIKYDIEEFYRRQTQTKAMKEHRRLSLTPSRKDSGRLSFGGMSISSVSPASPHVNNIAVQSPRFSTPRLRKGALSKLSRLSDHIEEDDLENHQMVRDIAKSIEESVQSLSMQEDTRKRARDIVLSPFHKRKSHVPSNSSSIGNN